MVFLFYMRDTEHRHRPVHLGASCVCSITREGS